MSDQLWEVVGGAGKGGILVREGKDLKSAELPERLSTGALVKQLALESGRLKFQRCTGSGPQQGWVSLKLKEAELLVRSTTKAAAAPRPPVLVCFYCGGCTAPQGKKVLEPFVSKAKAAGLDEVVIMDHIEETGFEDCRDWGDYVERMAGSLEVEAGPLQERSYIIFAHSHGCVPAWGLAGRLSSRCLKLYLVGRRPPNGALLDDVWGVDSGPKLAGVEDEFLLQRMLEAWPNPDLQMSHEDQPMNPMIKNILVVVRRQYSSLVYPAGSRDAPSICSNDPTVEAPILAIAASDETPRGETAEKMQGWKDFTKSSCEVVTLEATHMGIIRNRNFQETVVKDMLEVIREAGLER